MLGSLHLPRLRFWHATLVVLLGCAQGEPESAAPQDPTTMRLAPVSGAITVRGAPLANAVVTFLPKSGATSVAETDKSGRYALKTLGRDGAAPGDYKVAVSYLVSAEGKPQGLGPRSALVQPAGMLSAKELLPDKYSELGRTTLSATVGDDGGTFNFDLDAALPPVGAEAKSAEPAAGKAAEKPEAAPDKKD